MFKFSFNPTNLAQGQQLKSPHNDLQLIKLFTRLFSHVPTPIILCLRIAKYDCIDGPKMAKFIHVLDDASDREIGHSATKVVTKIFEVRFTEESSPSA